MDKAEDIDPETPKADKPRVTKGSSGRKPKSSYDWGVIDGGFAKSKRPNPPDDLTEAQSEIWRRIVGSEPPDFFHSRAVLDMLKDLVCHREAIDGLTQTLNTFRLEWLKSEEGSKRYGKLLKMRADETRAFSSIATKLRLTNQSRYTPRSAATADRNQAKLRPWEEED